MNLKGLVIICVAFVAGAAATLMIPRDVQAQTATGPRIVGYTSHGLSQLLLYQYPNGSLVQCLHTVRGGAPGACYAVGAPTAPVAPPR